MPDRTSHTVLGYNLGSAEDWDGDETYLGLFKWSPGPDVTLVIPNHRGDWLDISIGLEEGDVEITARDDNDDEDALVWKGTWQELIGHTNSHRIACHAQQEREPNAES